MDIRRLEQLAAMGDRDAQLQLERERMRMNVDQVPWFTSIPVCVEQAKLLTDLFVQGRISFVDYIESVFQVCAAKKGQVLQLQSMKFNVSEENLQWNAYKIQKTMLGLKALFKDRTISIETKDYYGRKQYELTKVIVYVVPGKRGKKISLGREKIQQLVNAGAYLDTRASTSLDKQRRRGGSGQMFPASLTPKQNVLAFAPDKLFFGEVKPRYMSTGTAYLRHRAFSTCFFPWRCGVDFYFLEHRLPSQREKHNKLRSSVSPMAREMAREDIHGEYVFEADESTIRRNTERLIPSSDIRGGWALQPDGTWRKLGAR